MRWSKTMTLVEAHAEGEVGSVITGGVIDIPGKTMTDKMDYLNNVDDAIRRMAIFEPRGKAQMSANLLLAPTHPDADAGFIILQPDRAHPMSGSNAICVTTVLLETGLVQMVEPETVVTLETPAGLVKATATCKDGKCERVSLAMTPSFADQLDVTVEVEGIGPVTVDIAYGGVFYALVDPKALGLEITPKSARDLVTVGGKIKAALNETMEVQHPEIPSVNSIAYVMFVDRDEDCGDFRGATIMHPGRIDRSPCGTGNSARLAVMHAKGQISVGDSILAKSIIDSEFHVAIEGTTKVAGRDAILPRVSGRAWIYGMHQIGVDPSDPYPNGFAVSDTWGPDV